MELLLFSCEVIVMLVVVGFFYNMFDGVLFFGVCDKIVLGLVMVVFFFGYLFVIFVLLGLMVSGLLNKEKVCICQLYVEGKVDRMVLLELEVVFYYVLGICIFYGIVNINQMVVEFMGMQLLGFLFVYLDVLLCEVLIVVVVCQVICFIGNGNMWMLFGKMIDEKVVVNGIVVLLVIGGFINYIMYLVVMVCVVGILINWDDFLDLLEVVLLMVCLYLNGLVDINYFQVVGGVLVLMCELFNVGLLYEDVNIVVGFGLKCYMLEFWFNNGELDWCEGVERLLDNDVIVFFDKLFFFYGGIKVLSGNLGCVVMKMFVVLVENQIIEVFVMVFESQYDVLFVFDVGLFDWDCVVVVCYQGLKVNGMLELYKFMLLFGVLLDCCFKIVLVIDG